MIHMLTDGEGSEGGPAADTGSAMHAAAAALHRGAPLADAIEAMGEGLPRYPKANLAEAAAMFLSYARDTRNFEGTYLLVEKLVTFTIEAHETDPTGAPIAVEGTIDQVVELNGRLFVRDIKTTKRDMAETAAEYTLQLAAYCVGAAQLLGKPIAGAKLIYPRRYSHDPSTSPVHWQYAWGWDDLEHILESVRVNVANVRANRLYHAPSADCKWCHCRTPDVCLPALKEHKKRNQTPLPVIAETIDIEAVKLTMANLRFDPSGRLT